MKNLTLLSIFIAAAMNLLLSCNSNQTADQYLKDNSQRKSIISAIAHHQPYMADMMHEMMNSDSCKQMMSQSMMSDPGMKAMMMDDMMNMCKKDPSMCKMMMDKTMAMCDADSSRCAMMMEAMQPHPNVMKSMKGMHDMDMTPKK